MREKTARVLLLFWPAILVLGLFGQFARMVPRLPEAFCSRAERETLESGDPVLYGALARLRAAAASESGKDAQKVVMLAWHAPPDRDELLIFARYRAAYELFPVRVEFIELGRVPGPGDVIMLEAPPGGFPASVEEGEVALAAVGASAHPSTAGVCRVERGADGQIRLVRIHPQPAPSVRSVPKRRCLWVLGLGTLLAAGYLFCRGAGLGSFLGEEFPARMAGYFLSGSGFVVFLMLAGGFAGLRWNFPLLAGAALGLPLIAAILRRNKRPAPRASADAGGSRTDWIGVFLVTAGVFLALLQSVLPISAWANWDAWAIWDLKARACWIEGGIPFSYLTERRLGYSHPEYPLGFPFLHAYLGNWAGGIDNLSLRLLSPVFYLITLAVFAGLLGELGVWRGRLAKAGMLALVPQMLYQASSGHADLPLAAVYAACLLAALRAMRQAAPLWAVAWLGGLAASIKNEGAIWAVACLALAWLGTRGKPGSLARGTGAALLLLSLAGPWAAATRVLGLKATDLRLEISWIAPRIPERMGMLMRGFILETLGPGVTGERLTQGPAAPPRALGAHILGSWLLLWHVVALALVMGWRRLRSPPQGVVTVILALQLAAIGGAYLASAHDLGWHLMTSLGRLLLQIAPVFLALAWAVLLGGSAYSSKAS